MRLKWTYKTWWTGFFWLPPRLAIKMRLRTNFWLKRGVEFYSISSVLYGKKHLKLVRLAEERDVRLLALIAGSARDQSCCIYTTLRLLSDAATKLGELQSMNVKGG